MCHPIVEVPRLRIVKNKNPTSIQITAEQLIREGVYAKPDPFELADYRLRRRKEFEDIRHASPNVWVKYAKWEESQGDFARSRSIWEQALQHHVCYTNPNLWCRYATFEMSNSFPNHARNVWDRAVTLLPNVSQVWYKFVHMEEILGNIPGARQIFERWMTHSPDSQGWLSYIKFESRYNEIERARHIFDRFVQCHPQVDSCVRYAKFELNHGELHRARQCYERAVETVISVDAARSLFLAFAEFEEKCKETDRARSFTKELYRRFIEFEKRYGDKESIENTLASEKRFQYEERIEFGAGNKDRIRDVYERAISNLPPSEEKRYWQRYIYLWINYALYEELDAQDTDRTREVYRECLKRIPHHKFSFSKVWLLAAQFEIRQKNLDGAPARHKVFKKYIELELTLGNVDRCRALYTKYLEWAPECSYAWLKYAELEMSLSEIERARAIFQLATTQPALDAPDLLWKAYLDFEISLGELERTRQIYDRLLERTKHWKVWRNYAMFEANANMEGGSDIIQEQGQAAHERQRKKCLEAARRVFENALEYFRISAPELKEERVMLLEEWLNTESSFGQIGDVSLVENRLPKKLKRRREVVTEGGPAGYEEYYDYIFPEETASLSLNILEAA
ncbi:hypothetical protein AQUCO_02100217v1 [Aquilegia coerulea]|uniref:Pre-mRNA-splicing factor Syf1/CRNKL1-like C-terminal HAT-repeats domain-containing protein n=1 Tax=Aquilegia coerulea TaxID=218851 RepID=A0A2G5DFE6_AQUCA|nr:hypothetical protein AQUCO_02100217v1 [Aquilegia coerulea]